MWSMYRILFNKTGHNVNKIQIARIYNRSRIGSREWVGYGINGTAHYIDRFEYPFPAIRFRENTNELLALREKEKGDWRKLTCEEKKCLYRSSFCQTFSEMDAPTGQFKSFFGIALIVVSLSIWMVMGLRYFIYPPLPISLSEENRRSQLRKIIDLKGNPITGISSKWDYEADDWKKNVKKK